MPDASTTQRIMELFEKREERHEQEIRTQRDDSQRAMDTVVKFLGQRLDGIDKRLEDQGDQIKTVHKRLDDKEANCNRGTAIEKRLDSHCKEAKEQFDVQENRWRKVIAVSLLLAGGVAGTPKLIEVVSKLFGS